MYRILSALTALILLSIFGLVALPLAAQAPCPGVTTLVGTPEDRLMLAYNGADRPQDQIAALEQFAREHSDSKIMPCVNEYFTATYVKMGDFDKAIDYGEKDWANSYHSLNLMLNLTKAYVGAGKANSTAFAVIAKAPAQIKAESNIPRPEKADDETWLKLQREEEEALKQDRTYLEYAFFALLPRVSNAAKRVQYLDDFAKAYPDTANKAQVDYQYFVAWEMAGNTAKAEEYGEKAIGDDPNYVEALNAVAYHYALVRGARLEKAAGYARKAANVLPNMKKQEGMSERDFSSFKSTQMGMAHLTMGYVTLKGAETDRKVAPAIDHLKTASGLLGSSPELEAQSLYFLAYAYELQWPVPNHHLAAQALTKGASIPSRMQGQTQDLLEKVQRAERRAQ